MGPILERGESYCSAHDLVFLGDYCPGCKELDDEFDAWQAIRAAQGVK